MTILDCINAVVIIVIFCLDKIKFCNQHTSFYCGTPYCSVTVSVYISYSFDPLGSIGCYTCYVLHASHLK